MGYFEVCIYVVKIDDVDQLSLVSIDWLNPTICSISIDATVSFLHVNYTYM